MLRGFPYVLVALLVAAPVGLPAPTDLDGRQRTVSEGDGVADHVVLVSVDGLRPDFYMDPKRPTPYLQQMADDGVRALGVRGVFPSVTYPSHTTMITGVRPARHGVHYNRPFEPGPASGRWYWHADSVRVETLWDVVRAGGGRSAALFWPVTVGAPIDWNVPEIWSLDEGVTRRDAMAEHTRPPGWLGELERQATGSFLPYGTVAEAAGDWEFPVWDDRSGAMGAYIIEQIRPSLLAIHLVDTDHTQHVQGREHPDVRKAAARADRAIGRLVEAAGRAGTLECTAFIVTGDHGFVDVDTVLAPNVWLAGAGLLGPARTEGTEGMVGREVWDGREGATAERLPAQGAWRARFHVNGGSAFLHLRDPDDHAAVDEVRAALRGLDPSVRTRFRIVERPTLDSLGVHPGTPLAIAAERGVTFAAPAEGAAVRAGSGASHGHFPDLHPDMHTGFVAWGAGVPSGRTIRRLALEDVAPFVAALLGLELDAPDGAVPTGLLPPDYLEAAGASGDTLLDEAPSCS